MPVITPPKKQPNTKPQAEATPDQLRTNFAITPLAQNNEGLPAGWKWVKLGDVCEIINGKNQKEVINPKGKYPIYGSSGIFGYADKYLCNEGTTIVGRKGNINSPIYVTTKFWNVDTAFGLTPKADIDGKFLFYFCKGFNFHALDKSTTIPSLAKTDLLKIDISIPALNKQHAIVSKIEELLSELDKGKQQLETAQEQLKIYRQAVLKWAFEGKLTSSENKITIVPFGTAIKVVSGNTPKGLENISNNGSIQFYKVSDMNLEGNEVEMLNSKFNLTKDEILKLKVKLFPKGTVIFPKRGGAILTNKKRVLSTESAFDLNLMGALPNEKIASKYLFYWFVKLDLGKIYDGSNVPQINNKNIEPLNFPICNMEEQQFIVQEIESRLSVCDKVEATISTSLAQAETLRQSILKKAFEGKLLTPAAAQPNVYSKNEKNSNSSGGAK